MARLIRLSILSSLEACFLLHSNLGHLLSLKLNVIASKITIDDSDDFFDQLESFFHVVLL